MKRGGWSFIVGMKAFHLVKVVNWTGYRIMRMSHIWITSKNGGENVSEHNQFFWRKKKRYFSDICLHNHLLLCKNWMLGDPKQKVSHFLCYFLLNASYDDKQLSVTAENVWLLFSNKTCFSLATNTGNKRMIYKNDLSLICNKCVI